MQSSKLGSKGLAPLENHSQEQKPTAILSPQVKQSQCVNLMAQFNLSQLDPMSVGKQQPQSTKYSQSAANTQLYCIQLTGGRINDITGRKLVKNEKNKWSLSKNANSDNSQQFSKVKAKQPNSVWTSLAPMAKANIERAVPEQTEYHSTMHQVFKQYVNEISAMDAKEEPREKRNQSSKNKQKFNIVPQKQRTLPPYSSLQLHTPTQNIFEITFNNDLQKRQTTADSKQDKVVNDPDQKVKLMHRIANQSFQKAQTGTQSRSCTPNKAERSRTIQQNQEQSNQITIEVQTNSPLAQSIQFATLPTRQNKTAQTNEHSEIVKEWMPILQKKKTAEILVKQDLQHNKLEQVLQNNLTLLQQQAENLLQQQVNSQQEMYQFNSQQNTQKLSVAAKAGEMQIFSNDTLNYGAQAQSSAGYGLRKQGSGMNQALNVQRMPLAGKQETKGLRLAKEQLIMSSTIQTATDSMEQLHNQQLQLHKEFLNKNEKLFQPLLQGQTMFLNSHQSAFKEKVFDVNAPLLPTDEPQRNLVQKQKLIAMPSSTPNEPNQYELKEVKSPSKATQAQIQMLGQQQFSNFLIPSSADRKMNGSTSLQLIEQNAHPEAIESPLKLQDLRTSAQMAPNMIDMEKGRSLPPRKHYQYNKNSAEANNQIQQHFQLINASLSNPLQVTNQRSFSKQAYQGLIQSHQSAFQDTALKHGTSTERRNNKANTAINTGVAPSFRDQRLLIEGQPFESSLGIAGEQMNIKNNQAAARIQGIFGSKIIGSHPVAEEPFHPKLRNKFLPEVAGQKIVSPNLAPVQFNKEASQIGVEIMPIQIAKPAHIFANKNQVVKTNKHFIYDYLFVQISEAQYHREIGCRLKLQPRFCDTRREVEDIDQQLNEVGVSENKFESKLFMSKGPDQDKASDEKRMKDEPSISDPSESYMPTGSTNVRQHPLRSRSTANNTQTTTEDQKETGRVEALGMLPYTLQQTQFECLQVMTMPNIMTAYNEQRRKMHLPPDEEIDRDQMLKDFIKELGNTFADNNQRHKVTVKKKYVTDIIGCSMGAQNVAQQVIIIVADVENALVVQSSRKPRKQKQTAACSDESEDQVEEAKEVQRDIPNPAKKEKGQKTPQVSSSKAPTAIIQRRGYDSESEAKSSHSTTTSSTLPQFGRQRRGNGTNAENEETNTPQSNSRKVHSRSLSQIPKTRNFKKEEDDDLIGKKFLEEEKTNQLDKYPATKIKICQKIDAYDHNKNHPINKYFSDYNEFLRLVFKFRGSEKQYMNNIPYAVKVAKRLGINANKNMLLPATLKARETANALKEKLILAMCGILQRENDIDDKLYAGGAIFPHMTVNKTTVQEVQASKDWIADPANAKQFSNFYKCFVGKGNNSMLVRTLFKSRFWWLLHDKDDYDKVNFVWTQLRKKSLMEQFKCKLVKQEFANMPSKGVNQTSEKFKKRRFSSSQSRSPDKLDSTEKLNCLTTLNSTEKPDSKPADEGSKQPENKQVTRSEMYPYKLYNKIEDNYHLANKKALWINMRHYYEAIGEDPFNALPVTFHIKEGLDDPEFFKFQTYYETNINEKNIWIIKPGENTNRGQGIQVAKDFPEIKNLIAENTKSKKRTCIVQKYIHNPLLINRRKFDIRTYAMVTSVNGNYKAYFYEEGYLRTSCREFNVSNLANKFIHLTNDAIQKKAEDYGKFEAGNKLSYLDFQTYLDKNFAELNVCFERDILPQIKKLTTDCFRATWGKMDPNKRVNNFEVYGLDFMIDDEFKVYLIEVNTNPCLELSSPLLARLIPTMVENSLRIVVDPLFPPPENFSQKKHVLQDLCPENKYWLVFDESVDGPGLEEIFKEKANVIVEIDEEELSDADIEDNKNAAFD